MGGAILKDTTANSVTIGATVWASKQGRISFHKPTADLWGLKQGQDLEILVHNGTKLTSGLGKYTSGNEIHVRADDPTYPLLPQGMDVILTVIRPTRYWALVADPSRYRIRDAAANVEIDWWITAGKPIRPGDWVVIWQASDRKRQRGVVALGEVIDGPTYRSDEENPFWAKLQDPEKEKAVERVAIRYIQLVSPLWIGGPHDDLIANLSAARARGGTVFKVTPQQWGALTQFSADDPAKATAVSLIETRKYRMHKRIERNPSASREVKKLQGFRCKACQLDFKEMYGALGEDFIEVHHLRPISSLQDGEVATYDSATDFAVLCANCHRMIHRLPDPSNLEELKARIRTHRA